MQIYRDRLEWIRAKILLTLLLCAPFSFFPSIATPTSGFIALRVGLYQIIAIVFVALGLWPVWRDRKVLWRSSGVSLLSVAGLLLLSIATYFGSINKFRSMALVLSVCVLLLLVLSAWQLFLSAGEKLLPTRGLFYKFAIFYALVSIVQLVVATLSNESVLLCGGCSSTVFGFARVNGFAAEPQFWANAILPFFVYMMVEYYRERSKSMAIGLFASLLAITVTFSRGAFVAVFAAFIAYIVILIMKKELKLRPICSLGAVLGMSLLVGFSLLIGASTIKYKNSPYIAYNTFRGMVEQLSLGEISLSKKAEKVDKSQVVVNSSDTKSSEQTKPISSPTNQGVVEASESGRTEPAKMALRVWRMSASNFFFGVGLGNFSPYVQKYVDGNSPLSITVSIFYAYFLVEMGLLGTLLLSLPYIVSLRRLVKGSQRHASFIFVTMIAFLTQYFFAGSYINVVYIWLWLGVALGIGHVTNKSVKS